MVKKGRDLTDWLNLEIRIFTEIGTRYGTGLDAIFLDDEKAVFNREYFYDSPNNLEDIAPNEDDMCECLRLIDLKKLRPDHHLELVMDEGERRAVAFLQPDHRQSEVQKTSK